MSLILMGSTSGSITLSEPAVAGSNTISLPAVTGTVVVAGQNSAITSGTAVSASSTSVDFTSIPNWVKRITVELVGVSTNGTSNFLIQLGTSSGVVSSGYLSGLGTRGSDNTATAGFLVAINANAALNFSGIVPICLYNTNAWVTSGAMIRSDGFMNAFGGSIASLGGTLDRIRITTVNGTDTFDAGSINILYE